MEPYSAIEVECIVAAKREALFDEGFLGLSRAHRREVSGRRLKMSRRRWRPVVVRGKEGVSEPRAIEESVVMAGDGVGWWRVGLGRRGERGEVRWSREGDGKVGGLTWHSVRKVSESGPGVEARRSEIGWWVSLLRTMMERASVELSEDA